MEGTIAAHLPHLPNPLNFDRTKFVVVQLTDLSFREIALLVDGTARHEDVTVDIALIAVGIRVMQTHTKRRSVGIAQLKAKAAQKVPLRFRC